MGGRFRSKKQFIFFFLSSRNCNLSALTFGGTDECVESSDPNVGLLRGGGHQVERLEVVPVENGEGAVVEVVRADVFVAQHVRVFARPDLLYAFYAHCNTARKTLRYNNRNNNKSIKMRRELGTDQASEIGKTGKKTLSL